MTKALKTWLAESANSKAETRTGKALNRLNMLSVPVPKTRHLWNKLKTTKRRSVQGVTVNRPPLFPQRGRYFSYLMPQGWKVSESMSGLEMNSPDCKRQASFALLLRNQTAKQPLGQHGIDQELGRAGFFAG